MLQDGWWDRQELRLQGIRTLETRDHRCMGKVRIVIFLFIFCSSVHLLFIQKGDDSPVDQITSSYLRIEWRWQELPGQFWAGKHRNHRLVCSIRLFSSTERNQNRNMQNFGQFRLKIGFAIGDMFQRAKAEIFRWNFSIHATLWSLWLL